MIFVKGAGKGRRVSSKDRHPGNYLVSARFGSLAIIHLKENLIGRVRVITSFGEYSCLFL